MSFSKNDRWNCGDLVFILLRTTGLIALYYPLSISLTFYNKWFVKSFKFPLLIASFHFIIKFIFASIVRCLITKCNRNERVQLTWWDFFSKLSIVGLTASIDIGLSNWSLEFISISLYTMSKSTVIAFILLFAVLLRLEKLQPILVLVVFLISAGLFLFNYRSTSFQLTGFLLVELASASSGLRWTWSQMVFQRSKMGLSNPVDMIYFVQPWMLLAILPLMFAIEGEPLSTSATTFSATSWAVPLHFIFLIFVGASIAFLMEISEYLLLLYTSGLTLSICGMLKEIITLTLAHYYYHDSMSKTNFIGLVMCLLGVGVHAFFKLFNEMKEKHKQNSICSNGSEIELSARLLENSENDSSTDDQ